MPFLDLFLLFILFIVTFVKDAFDTFIFAVDGIEKFPVTDTFDAFIFITDTFVKDAFDAFIVAVASVFIASLFAKLVSKVYDASSIDGWWFKSLIDAIALQTSANISATLSGTLDGKIDDPILKKYDDKLYLLQE